MKVPGEALRGVLWHEQNRQVPKAPTIEAAEAMASISGKAADELRDMPDNLPPIGGFVPANGLIAVSFEHTHGKMLMDGLRPKIHHHVGGASQASNDRIYTVTNHLLTPSWMAAFNPPANE